jgi:hypothetical protein
MRWIWVLALVAGCGKSKEACKAQVDDLMTFLRKMDHSPSYILIPDDVHLVERPELKAVDGIEAPVVYVRPSGIEVRGNHFAVAELPHVLEDAAQKTEQDINDSKLPRSFAWDHRVYFVIDRDVPWSTVTALASAAEVTHYTKWIALFSKPSPVAAPPRSSVSDELDALLNDTVSGNKATKLAQLATKVVKSCAPLQKAFGSVGAVEVDDKAGALIEATGPAVAECSCDVDVPALRSIFFAVAGNLHPLTMVVITLDKTATPIALPPTTLWRDAAAKLSTTAAWLQ